MCIRDSYYYYYHYYYYYYYCHYYCYYYRNVLNNVDYRCGHGSARGASPALPIVVQSWLRAYVYELILMYVRIFCIYCRAHC